MSIRLGRMHEEQEVLGTITSPRLRGSSSVGRFFRYARCYHLVSRHHGSDAASSSAGSEGQACPARNICTACQYLDAWLVYVVAYLCPHEHGVNRRFQSWASIVGWQDSCRSFARPSRRRVQERAEVRSGVAVVGDTSSLRLDRSWVTFPHTCIRRLRR